MYIEKIVVDSAEEAFNKVLDHLKAYGKKSSPRGFEITEIENANIIIKNPRNRIISCPERKFNVAYAFGELAWYLSGNNSVDQIAYYSKFQRGCSDDGITLNSAYGARIFGIHNEDDFVKYYDKIEFDQWKDCVNKLKNDHDTRQAIIHLHTPNNKKTKDEVCTLTLQFLIRDNKLNMITTMRSNDIVLGFTYDVFAFTFMQELMANELNVELGCYCHNVGSMHIYTKEYYHMKIDLLENHNLLKLKPMDKIDFDLYSNEIRDFIEYERGMRKQEGQQECTVVENEFEAFYKYTFFIKYCQKMNYEKEIINAKIQELRDMGYEYVADMLYLTSKGKHEGKKIVIEGIDGSGKDNFINTNYKNDEYDFIHFGLPSDSFDFYENYKIHILSDKCEVLNRFFISEEVYSFLREKSRIEKENLEDLFKLAKEKNIEFKIFIFEDEKQKNDLKSRMIKNNDKDLLIYIDKINDRYKKIGLMMRDFYGIDVSFYNIMGKEININV